MSPNYYQRTKLLYSQSSYKFTRCQNMQPKLRPSNSSTAWTKGRRRAQSRIGNNTINGSLLKHLMHGFLVLKRFFMHSRRRDQATRSLSALLSMQSKLGFSCSKPSSVFSIHRKFHPRRIHSPVLPKTVIGSSAKRFLTTSI